MKNSFYLIARLVLPALLLFSIAANAQQKYPKIQEISLRAPDDIKIDGNTKEWQHKYQAWTTVDRMFYTISNDDNKLYLSVGTEGPYAIQKIMYGGVTLTISKSTEKRKREKDADNVSVTFPVIDITKARPLVSGDYKYFVDFIQDTVVNRPRIDSLVEAMQEAPKEFKEIKVKGIKDITDTLISVYNTEGIRAAATFDKHIRYTYELAIPLKYLGLSATDATKFSYNIKLTGLPPMRVVISGHAPLNMSSMATPPTLINISNQSINPLHEYLYYPTDFWAEYTLAKK